MVYQEKVLQPLGAITTGSQFLEPDGKESGRFLCGALRVLQHLGSE